MDALMQRGYTTFVRLDSGGQAKVYRTTKHDRIYAIKVVPIEAQNVEKLDQDLRRELNISHNLRHPNCIRVEDMFRTKKRVYIVMDYMPNGTIGNKVRKDGPLSEWNVKCWFPPIVRAVNYLHENLIAHRDLKLDNVLLDQYFNPILSDYGFSRFIEYEHNNPNNEVKLSHTFCGTRSHNPPEVLMYQPYNPFKCDIWCLGIVLFIMINQVYPFDRNEPRSVMYNKQMKRNYHLQSKIESIISNNLKHLINTLLEPIPSKRPSIDQLCRHQWFPIIYQELNIYRTIKKQSQQQQQQQDNG